MYEPNEERETSMEVNRKYQQQWNETVKYWLIMTGILFKQKIIHKKLPG